MKKYSQKTMEEVADSYQYLFEKIMKENRKDLAPFVLSFREQLLKEEKLRSYSDLIAIDILYFHSVNNADEPWKGREAANEAYTVLTNRETTLEKDEILGAYLQLAEVFNFLEDVDKERTYYDKASYFAFLLKDKEKAVAAKEKEIKLVWRYEESERKNLFPKYEELVMQFGLSEAKRLLALESEKPLRIHDPIETNPLFPKIIDKVNVELKEFFNEHKEEFSIERYNEKKHQFLLKYGIDWKEPA